LTPTLKTRRLLSRLSEHSSKTTDTIAEGIPLAGVVAAGQPIEAVENKDCISINSFFGSCDDVFALAVRGDSMAGADIHSGDYVICKRGNTATDGQLVVAIVDNENATLKRFYREPGRARLQPANDDYKPIYSDNCRIEGVVIGLIRKL
jgi:repressor LexA